MRLCEVEGCDKKHRAKGMCQQHYQKKYFARLRAENPEKMRKYKRDYYYNGGRDVGYAWRARNPDKVARYDQAAYQNRKDCAKTRARVNEWKAADRAAAGDTYIRGLISGKSGGKIASADIPTAMIEAKRLHIKSKRVLKKHGINV